MVEKEILKQVEDDFKFILNDPAIFALILFGSHAVGAQTPRSDIDICIVAPNQDLYEIYRTITHQMEGDQEKYDIRFFEELPLHVQAEIIKDGHIIYCREKSSLHEYFFPFIKRWEDQQVKLKLLSL